MSKQKLTDRQLASGVTLTDLVHIVITGDTSQSSAGSSYKATIQQISDVIGGGGGMFTGGTVTGPTIFTNGLSANTISATTYLNLPTFTGNTSGDCITDLYVTNLYGCSPITVNDDLILISGLTATSVNIQNVLSGTPILNLGVDTDGNVVSGLTLGDNIYNIDGTLTTGRTVNVSEYSLTISGESDNVLTIVGSGDTEPLFTVQGSSGELFSITDDLTGSLFAVNDISGLPILEVFDNDTVLMGSNQSPSLNTTVKLNPGTGLSTVYSLPMSAYTGAFFDYTVTNTGGARAGNVMSIFSGNTVNFTETTTTDIGSTSGITFSMSADSTNTILQVSATTTGWEVKTIVRSI